MSDKLLAALKSIADEKGLTRIDIGYAGYCTDRPAYASIWFEAPEGVIGHAAEHGCDCDEAIDNAIAQMERKLAAAPIAEAA